MLNIGVVQLSDGRMIRVVAEHEGVIEVTLVYPEIPQGTARPMDWSSFQIKMTPERLFQEDQLRAYEEHAEHDDVLVASCEHCKASVPFAVVSTDDETH